MNIIPDQIDIDDEPICHAPRRPLDEPDQPTCQETLQEARDFHDSWSKANPYEVYGGNTPLATAIK